jgi:hypothetical protein
VILAIGVVLNVTLAGADAPASSGLPIPHRSLACFHPSTSSARFPRIGFRTHRNACHGKSRYLAWVSKSVAVRPRIYGPGLTPIPSTPVNAQATPVPPLVFPTPPPDTTPPDTSITSGPSGTTTATIASFSFASTESGSTFECKLDGAAWSSCAAPKTYSGLSDGEHQFSVRASDASSNLDLTPANRSWTVSVPPPAECSSTVSALSALQSALSSADPGQAVCLADGSYGELTLNASKAPPGVAVRAAHAGQATIAGVTMQGSNLTVANFDISGEVEVEPGSSGMTVEHNRISGGYFGVDAGPTDTITVDDVAIVGNELIGPFGEDAIRLNRYHDANGDGIGVLIEGNEITGVRENGNHSDCLQAVWVGDHIIFRKNYVHDNRCQGFFVMDLATAVDGISVEDNLFLRDDEPCAPEAPGCGQPSIFQVFGPYTGYTMTNNTIWDGDDQTSFQNGSSPDSLIAGNVISRLWTSTPIQGIYSDNTRCKREEAAGGSWPTPTGEVVDCDPPFADPAADDYRLGNGRGVDWAPAGMHFGP